MPNESGVIELGKIFHRQIRRLEEQDDEEYREELMRHVRKLPTRILKERTQLMEKDVLSGKEGTYIDWKGEQLYVRFSSKKCIEFHVYEMELRRRNH